MKINDLTERPARYWLEDGLVDLFFGLHWLALGGVLRIASPAVEATLLLCWGVATLGAVAIFWRLKGVLAGKAGYIGRPKASVLSWRSAASIVGAILLCLAVAVWLDWTRERTPLAGWTGYGFGCAFAVYYAWIAAQFKMPRYVWIAAAALCAAITTYGDVHVFRTVPAVLMLVAGSLAVLGAIALIQFLPARKIEEEQ